MNLELRAWSLALGCETLETRYETFSELGVGFGNRDKRLDMKDARLEMSDERQEMRDMKLGIRD